MPVSISFLLAFLLYTSVPAQALTILTEESPPSTILRPDGPSGLSVEVVREIQKRTGNTSRIEVLPWARAYDIAIHEKDVVLFATTRTPERENLFSWIGPLLSIKWAFFGLRGKARPLANLEEARKAPSIGVYNGDAREVFLKDHGFTNLDSATNPVGNLLKLKAGRVEYIVSTDTGLRAMFDQAGMQPEDVVNVLTFKDDVGLYIAISRGSDPATVTAWKKAFEAMTRDGTFQAIRERWIH